jgi:lysophospholipase L1-like esterase
MTGLLLVASFLLTGWNEARGELFKDGETVCFLGDSITHGGRYHGLICDYYATRFPDRTVRFVNAGVPGDTAWGALNRLQADVIDKKPTSVAIMFGMNDVGRGNYVAEPTAAQKAAHQRAQDGYRTSMEKLVGRIRAEAGEPKLFLITPSPFDQTCVNSRTNNQPGCNDGLGRCAATVRDLAAKNSAALVEFYEPMTALNLEQQKKDPTYTIVGADRVHPGVPGHLMMAWLFLKAQGAPAIVSKVTVDAASGLTAESVNAEVTAVAKKDGGVTFTMLEKALPFPIPASAKPVLSLLPIERDLNQETLSVTGLKPGKYELRIDGAAVGQYTEGDLAEGVNLASNERAPQVKQALEVARANEARRGAESQTRSLLSMRRSLEPRYKLNPDDLTALQAYYDKLESKKDYTAVMLLNYIKNWPKHSDILKSAAECEKKALDLRRPVPHAYAVVPAGTERK